jgi:DNA-binding CsgD family transcriptional regulator
MSLWADTHDIITRLDKQPTPRAVGETLLQALSAFGVRGMFAGSFPAVPQARITGYEILAQFSPRGWQDAYARRQLHDGNPVIHALGRTTRPFRWSEGGVPALKGWKGLNLARELGIADGLAVPTPELAGRLGVMSIGFERFEFSPRESRVLQLLSIVAYERMRGLSARPAPPVTLTARERDCLAFVAEGKSDAAIARVLGVSATTVHWHVENAKRKLGAKTRTQAVAKLYTNGLL